MPDDLKGSKRGHLNPIFRGLDLGANFMIFSQVATRFWLWGQKVHPVPANAAENDCFGYPFGDRRGGKLEGILWHQGIGIGKGNCR